MTSSATTQRATPLWWGVGLAVLALGFNVFFFQAWPGQRLAAWISAACTLLALVLVGPGAVRLFRSPATTARKLVGALVALIALGAIGISSMAFIVARKLPASDAAPQIGQQAPDFTLRDTNGTPVSLTQLLTQPALGAATPPKAVLLVFYRGWW